MSNLSNPMQGPDTPLIPLAESKKFGLFLAAKRVTRRNQFNELEYGLSFQALKQNGVNVPPQRVWKTTVWNPLSLIELYGAVTKTRRFLRNIHHKLDRVSEQTVVPEVKLVDGLYFNAVVEPRREDPNRAKTPYQGLPDQRSHHERRPQRPQYLIRSFLKLNPKSRILFELNYQSLQTIDSCIANFLVPYLFDLTWHDNGQDVVTLTANASGLLFKIRPGTLNSERLGSAGEVAVCIRPGLRLASLIQHLEKAMLPLGGKDDPSPLPPRFEQKFGDLRVLVSQDQMGQHSMHLENGPVRVNCKLDLRSMALLMLAAEMVETRSMSELSVPVSDHEAHTIRRFLATTEDFKDRPVEDSDIVDFMTRLISDYGAKIEEHLGPSETAGSDHLLPELVADGENIPIVDPSMSDLPTSASAASAA